MVATYCRWVLLGLLVVIIVGGCGDSGSSDTAESMVEVSTGDEAKVPDAFPSDIPLPDDLSVVNVSALPAQDTYVVQGTVPEELETVSMNTKSAIEQAGWTEVTPPQVQELPDMKMMNFKKEGKILNVTLFREDTGTSVNLTTSPG